MGTLKDTDWPPEFPNPMRGGVRVLNDKTEILRNNQDLISNQTENRLDLEYDVELKFQFSGYWFYIFEGWFRYNLWRGIRGCGMDIPVGNVTKSATVFFDRGYTADHDNVLNTYTVTAVVSVLV